MEIHKPKPVHSWRELLTEIGVVVIGVGIALAAEQTVEYLHWRTQVAEARVLIATELTRNVHQGIWRMRTSACVEHRLDELGTILDAATKTGSLPPVGDIAMPVRGYWPNGSWESVVASQTATHFPRQQLAKITFAYQQIARLEEFSVEEIAAWDALYAIVGPGRRLDPASEARMREALSHARSINRLMAVIGNQMAVQVSTIGLTFSPDNLAEIAQAKREPFFAPRSILNGGEPIGAICAPLGNAPSVYGQGFYDKAAPLLNDAVKSLPDFGSGAK